MRKTAHMAVALSALALMGASASVASAASEEYMHNAGLSPGNAFASNSAHSGVTHVGGVGDHTSCPALAQGYTGYVSNPRSGGHNTAYTDCGIATSWYPAGTAGIYFHGAAFNPNQATYDYVYYGYDW